MCVLCCFTYLEFLWLNLQHKFGITGEIFKIEICPKIQISQPNETPQTWKYPPKDISSNDPNIKDLDAMNWINNTVSEWVGSMELTCFFLLLGSQSGAEKYHFMENIQISLFCIFPVVNKQGMAGRVWIIYQLFLAGSTNDTTRGAQDPFLENLPKSAKKSAPKSEGESVFVTRGFPLPIRFLDLADLFNVGFWDCQRFQWRKRFFNLEFGSFEASPFPLGQCRAYPTK